jgi:hypothetical protein
VQRIRPYSVDFNALPRSPENSVSDRIGLSLLYSDTSPPNTKADNKGADASSNALLNIPSTIPPALPINIPSITLTTGSSSDPPIHRNGHIKQPIVTPPIRNTADPAYYIPYAGRDESRILGAGIYRKLVEPWRVQLGRPQSDEEAFPVGGAIGKTKTFEVRHDWEQAAADETPTCTLNVVKATDTVIRDSTDRHMLWV